MSMADDIAARLAQADRKFGDGFKDVRARLRTPRAERPPMTQAMKRRYREYMLRYSGDYSMGGAEEEEEPVV